MLLLGHRRHLPPSHAPPARVWLVPCSARAPANPPLCWTSSQPLWAKSPLSKEGPQPPRPSRGLPRLPSSPASPRQPHPSGPPHHRLTPGTGLLKGLGSVPEPFLCCREEGVTTATSTPSSSRRKRERGIRHPDETKPLPSSGLLKGRLP